jgi:hypothetical protein
MGDRHVGASDRARGWHREGRWRRRATSSSSSLSVCVSLSLPPSRLRQAAGDKSSPGRAWRAAPRTLETAGVSLSSSFSLSLSLSIYLSLWRHQESGPRGRRRALRVCGAAHDGVHRKESTSPLPSRAPSATLLLLPSPLLAAEVLSRLSPAGAGGPLATLPRRRSERPPRSFSPPLSPTRRCPPLRSTTSPDLVGSRCCMLPSHLWPPQTEPPSCGARHSPSARVTLLHPHLLASKHTEKEDSMASVCTGQPALPRASPSHLRSPQTEPPSHDARHRSPLTGPFSPLRPRLLASKHTHRERGGLI